MTINIAPFQPQPGLTDPHVQTIGAAMLRQKRGITFQRLRLDTADGDFVDVDFPTVKGYRWLWSELGEKSPMVLVLHGLEGSARGHLALEIYRQLAKQGIRSVGLNFRSCSGEMNRTPILYHSGATFDVAFLLEWLAANYPGAPKGLIGFSLGANVVLKYMGTGARFVETAVAISTPFDLALGAAVLEDSGVFYMNLIMRSLKRKARLMRPIIEELVDVDRILAAETFREFDDLWQTVNGFKDGSDYYEQCSAKRFLPHITKPTLILRSLDDPFFDVNDIPYDLLQNPALQTVLTEKGGHGGFLEHASPLGSRFWAEREGARFLAAKLSPNESPDPNLCLGLIRL